MARKTKTYTTEMESQAKKGYTDSSGKNIVSTRHKNNQRTDTVKEVSVGLYDADEAIYYYFENVIQPRIKENNKEIRVPIVYGSPERWKSVQKSGVFRDKTGKVQFPILMYKRTGIERLEGYSKLDANYPNLFYTVGKHYNPRNRYDQFEILVGRKKAREYYNVVIPDYVKLTYECILVTEFIGHQNKIIEDINYASNSYWGKENYFKFLANMSTFDVTNELTQGEDRGIRATFALELNGYIIPDNLQKDMTQYNKQSHGIARVIMGTEVVSDINDLPANADGENISVVEGLGLAGKNSYYKNGSGGQGMIPKLDILKGHGQKK